MDDTATGFRLGEAGFFPWGTRFNAVVRDFEGMGYACRPLPCTEAYGFATCSAEPSSPRPDRPVLSVTYELAATATPSKDLFARLVIRLGAPQTIQRDELSPHAGLSSHVVLHATWRTVDGIPIGLSLYGAPRATEFGESAGALYLSWGDLEAAAAPWIGDWHAANDAVPRAAQSPGPIERFRVGYDVRTSDAHEPLRIAHRCLNAPELLETPRSIALGLGDRGFALWSDATGRRWHLSTSACTIVLGGPETSRVRVASVQPARGGGFSSIDIGGWWARDAWNSRAIEEAVHALDRVPGLTIERSSGHDV
ncbi:hypothetical protein [Reyranella sp.]|uniref:hypothetical protein n=1 Tax=Reyranella sp. TaxID=1929291 RepID=UPI00403708F0